MALTKVSYSMIEGSEVNILDFIPQSEHAAIRAVTSTYDCAPAFNAALATGKSVYVPIGRYQINSALNFTNRAAGGQRLYGEGWGISNSGSVIQASTGGVAIDCTGSQCLMIENIAIDAVYGAPSNPSKVGILLARSNVSQYSQFITINNVYIRMPHDNAANNGNGTVGIYNVAAEIHHYDNVYAIADTPLAFNPYNTGWAVQSPYTSIDTSIVSMSMINVTGETTLQSLSTSRSCIFARNAFGLNFDNIYLTGEPATGCDFDGVVNVTFNAHLEAGDSAPVATLKNCETLDFRWTGGPTLASPIYLGTTFTSISNASFTSNGADVGWPYVIEGLFTSVLKNIRINLTADAGTVATTNIVNTSGIFRVIDKGLTNGGFTFQNVPDAMTFQPIAAASVSGNQLFHDTSNGKISWKDNAGVVHALY